VRRRQFLALATLPLLTGCDLHLSLEQGLESECRDPVMPMSDPLVAAAWQGIRPDRVWDVHAHLFGNGREKGGIWVEPDYDHPKSIGARIRHRFFMNAGCVGSDEDKLDSAMVARVSRLIDTFPEGARLMLLAFDFTYDEGGRRREDLTTFCVPNDYARRIASMRPDRFEWIASVHPYRDDAAQALADAKAAGARAVKWLPPAMGIDLRHAKSLAFYDELVKRDLPLLAHLGEEQAVRGAHRPLLGNPLHVRAALERGVRVIGAHCATLGTSADLDADPNPEKAPQATNFSLFARLMADKRFEGKLFGDISAVTQVNRAEFLPHLLAKAPAWEGRLLNGSDYPLPGIMPLFSPKRMVRDGCLAESALPALRELRESNALAFDFVLKRSLRLGGNRFPASAFETREFFAGVRTNV
jgi:mannonate dehydratase